MPKKNTVNNLVLFTLAEKQARDLALNNRQHHFGWHEKITGLLSATEIDKEINTLKSLHVDDYIARVLEPAEAASRPSAKAIVRKLKGKVYQEVDMGPYYAVDIDLSTSGTTRRVGILAQNRSVKNGVWGPEHHLEACRQVREWARRSLPIVTFMDTPGADAGQEANANNQAHAISRLIAEMTNAAVPTVGIIYGLGYSGGAIPLAATNVLLSVNSGVFNTIQPKGLANIARQYNLSWQESARYVGVSPSELFSKGVIDGVINWGPESTEQDSRLLADTIANALSAIEITASKQLNEKPDILEDYKNRIERALAPREKLQELERGANFSVNNNISEFPSLFDHSMAYMRYLGMRTRISSISVDSYGRLAEEEIPTGDLDERLLSSREESFNNWHQDPEKLVYQDPLHKAWSNYKQKHADINKERGRFTTILLGDPQKNFEDARRQLCFQIVLYLYNRWKSDASFNFVRMSQLIDEKNASGEADMLYRKNDIDVTILDLVYAADLSDSFQKEFENILIFNALYNTIINSFADIAEETRAFHTLSKESLQKILDTSLEKATHQVAEYSLPGTAHSDAPAQTARQSRNFADWLQYFTKFRKRGDFLSDVEEWKRVFFPRLSDSLLVLITFFFETLIPEFLNSQLQGKPFEGRINPVRIGKRKDFWNQLTIAYKDLRVQRILEGFKREKKSTVHAFQKQFFSSFEELNADRMTSDPVNFPGFRISIEKALAMDIQPCGVVTGIGKLKSGNRARVGVVISNVLFQAGAFDMASAEKLCDLMVECAQQGLPIIAFVSSGGMQTKEGPNALFSMSITNDRITRFVEETGLPIIVFGFGDCTGGSQASFVTHPLVHTYYFSGADLPFAGRVVVPSFLPSMCTVSNYLCRTPGAMKGLVKHPFAEGLDEKLRDVDPAISIPVDSVDDVVQRILEDQDISEAVTVTEDEIKARDLMAPINKVLIHARGCTAVKLIRIAQKLDKQVLLVQSDPDMDSVAVDMLKEQDEVVSLGGQTPDESYLNGLSVVTIGNRYNADALHPGIGFLSENADYVRLCRKHRLNVIGPKGRSMDTMGNKSNAIHTSMANDVPVVPGSHGILTSAEATAKVADEIGYPVLLKAVHGGGGKGIKVVRNPGEIREQFNTVFAEARSAFGNGDLYLEKFVESMRHIEVQVLRDSHGNTRILGLRDCTVQRNNQKVLEESGSTMLPKKLEKICYSSAESLANAVDYIGAGTVEFIYDLVNNSVYFMEMNTRLQVEHPVTEWTSGISIVSEQFRIAEGESIEHLQPKSDGFAIEARITAEKAALDKAGNIDFRPTPGLVTECSFPERDDMELIATVATGKTISPFYDSMIAQLIVHGKDRNDAIARLLETLDQTLIKGVCTNIPLLKKILADATFVKGKYDTSYLPTFLDGIDKDALIKEMAYTGVEEEETSSDELRIEGTDELKVLAPMTGIFYSTPAPTEPEYAPVGARKEITDTLCQIEAMKLFTQISLTSVRGAGELFESGRQYEIVRVNQANGVQVNAGDLLFVVKPVA